MTTALTKPVPATQAAPGEGTLPVQVETLSASGAARWDQFVTTSANGTFFHTTAWMRAVRDAFHHEPIYLYARRDMQITGVLPLFRVRSCLAGTMLVSVPYAVYGGVVADDQESSQALIREARSIMVRCKARTLDLRSIHAACPDEKVTSRHVTFQRELPHSIEDVLNWLPRKARAAARNARNKHGLTASFDDSHLEEVWRLYCRSMHRLASLNYPFRFFANLMENTPGSHSICLVRHNEKAIGGLITFYFGDTALPYFVGCDERYNRLNVNNFIYLVNMEEAVKRGCRVYDFGRTRIDNKGSFDFKRFHGFDPKPLEYQQIVAEGVRPPDLTPANPRFRIARQYWTRLPRPVTRWLGGYLSKHIPG